MAAMHAAGVGPPAAALYAERMHALAPPRLTSPRVLLSFALIVLIWGSTWLVIRSQLGVVPPVWSVAYRFLIAGVAMLALCLVLRRPLRLTPGGHGFALAIGVCQFSLNFNFVYHAEERLTSGLVAVVFALLVVANALLAWLFLRQKATRGFLAGGAIGIAGLALLFAPDLAGAGAPDKLAGIGLTLLGVLSAGVANVMQSSPRGRAQPLEGALALAMLYGGALNAGWALATVGPPSFEPTLEYAAGLLYLALVASALAFTLYYALIRRIGAARAAYSSVVIPLVALLLSTLFEGYVWTPLAVIGALVTTLGLVIALRSRA